MDSINEENGVHHPCFLMKKQAEHQCKDSFNSLILWSIVVFRLGIICYVTVLISRTTLKMLETSCSFQMATVTEVIIFFNFFKKNFRQELCLQQVLFLPQAVLHLSHSQEQHLEWWVSFVMLLSFLHPERYSHCINLQPPAGTGVPMMPQQPVMYGQPMMRPPFGAATGPGVQVSITTGWKFNCFTFL